MKNAATTLAGGVALTGLLQAWRLARAVRIGRTMHERTCAFSRWEGGGSPRVLVLGDSTGVGLGADRADDSIAGLLAAEFGPICVVNVARDGARVADALATARELRRAGVERFDIVLLHVGGNDVLHGTPSSALRASSKRLLVELAAIGRHTVWLGAANVGLSPAFVPPFSWWLASRGCRARDVFQSAARGAGAHFVDFFHGRADDPFSRDVERYYAADRVHPSSRSYRHCYEALKRATPLAQWLVPEARQVADAVLTQRGRVVAGALMTNMPSRGSRAAVDSRQMFHG